MRPRLRSMLLACALALPWAASPHGAPVRADGFYAIDRVEPGATHVRVFAHAALAPVVAVARREATRAARLAAPSLFADRDLGTSRLRDLALEVVDVRFARGQGAAEVRLDVSARVTAQREVRRLIWDGVLPRFVWEPQGRRAVADGRLVVRARVRIPSGDRVVLDILGDRLSLSAPLAVDLPLAGRVLHTHVERVPPHPSIEGLRPEAAALTGLEGDVMRFVVRFRRVS